MDDLYFDREGLPITHKQWGELFENFDYRVVARDEVPTRLSSGRRVTAGVSTVWLGINHRYDDAGPPLIFETLVFEGPADGEIWRYATEQQALAGHMDVVRWVKSL